MAFISDKVSRNTVFFLSGLLLFGTYNNFYNLILLLYIKDIAKADLRSFIKMLFAWALFFVAGYMVMLVLLKILSGHWGLQIGDWRNPRYIHGLNDVIANLERVWGSFKENLALAGPVFVTAGLAGFCLLFSVFDVITGKKGNRIRNLFVLVAVCAVALAGYVQSVPFGLGVETRAAVGIYTAIAVLVLLLCTRCRNIGLIFVFVIAMSEYCMNVDFIRYYSSLTNTWRQSIISMNINPAKTDMVHICSKDNAIQASELRISHNLAMPSLNYFWNNMLQIPSFFSVGFRNFDSAGFNNSDSTPEQCQQVINESRQRNGIHSWVYKNNHLYVWYE